MSTVYTLAIVDYGANRYEALYADGRLIAQAEDEHFSAAGLLEALAANDIGIRPAYVDVDHDYDQTVLADHGWPELLSDVKPTAPTSQHVDEDPERSMQEDRVDIP